MRNRAHFVIQDTIPAAIHPGTGLYTESRSQWAKWDKETGYITSGTVQRARKENIEEKKGEQSEGQTSQFPTPSHCVLFFAQQKKKFLVIDYDPDVIDEITRRGYDSVYGDATDPELLEEVETVEDEELWLEQNPATDDDAVEMFPERVRR